MGDSHTISIALRSLQRGLLFLHANISPSPFTNAELATSAFTKCVMPLQLLRFVGKGIASENTFDSFMVITTNIVTFSLFLWLYQNVASRDNKEPKKPSFDTKNYSPGVVVVSFSFLRQRTKTKKRSARRKANRYVQTQTPAKRATDKKRT